MKKIIFALVLASANISFADQCAYNTEAHANAARDLLKAGSQVIDFCEPCSNQTKRFSTVTSSDVKVVEDGKYYLVTVNGRGIDLAYTFIKTKSKVTPTDSDTYSNVAMLVGCPVSSVSATIDVQ